MSRIENTSKRFRDNPVAEGMLLLAQGMGGNPGAGIEAQERTGQSQLVHSDRLPAKMGDQAAYEALGFTFGPVDEDDPLFRPATLPQGWEKRATDHSMGSVIVDTLGRERVSIFYKAAFYDRDAHMTLISLGWYVTVHVEYDGPLVLDDEWATHEAVIAAMAGHRDAILTEAAEFREFAASDDPRRDARNRENCARIAGEREAKAELYAERIRQLEAERS